jgi:3' terminal RNA ribose 2'-O-methyltransferase Hen1
MLLTISTTHQPATDLGYLLAKHPAKLQTFEVPGGQAHVFYPEVTPERCTAALMLNLDPVLLTRQEGERVNEFALQPYVNDRPYVASSWLSTAIIKVFSSALNGRCREYPDMPLEDWPFEAVLSAIPGSDESLRRLFEPLGYAVETQRDLNDPHFPEWGQSRYVTLTLRKTCRLAELLSQLYILIPVLDHDKHYFQAGDEAEKLLAKGGDWLEQHPEKNFIIRRYLHRSGLVKNFNALAEAAQEPEAPESENISAPDALTEPKPEGRDFRLHDLRLHSAFARVKAVGARSVLDLGCGEGKLLRLLLDEPQFERIMGMDVSLYALGIAKRRLKLDRMNERDQARITLAQGSVTYRDRRMEGFDAAVMVEVIEHLEPHRLPAMERTVFEYARPGTVVVTTPRAEYNQRFESLAAGAFRHSDHRFEWTEQEFQDWGNRIAAAYHYAVFFTGIGEPFETFGVPSQMAIFTLK